MGKRENWINLFSLRREKTGGSESENWNVLAFFVGATFSSPFVMDIT